METSLLQYYQNGDISLMKQFLLTFPIFNQIHYYLDNDKFYQFLQCIEVHPVTCSIPLELNSMSTYLFLSTGILIPKKQKKHNFQRLSRLSRSVKFTHIMMAKQIFNQEHQRQSQKIKTIFLNQLYNQSLLYNSNFIGQSHYFVSNSQRKSLIIGLNFKNIPQNVLLDLRQKHNQKLKFIGNCDLFKHVQKNLIQNNLSKFYVLKVSFDQCLLKQPSLRTNHLFFLTSGQVQIFIDQKQTKKTYLTKAPAIIGFQKIKCAKSVTECCLCFYIEKSQVIDILKRNMQGKHRNPFTEQYLKKLLKSIGIQKHSPSQHNTSKGINPTNILSGEQVNRRFERANTTPISMFPNQQQNENQLFKPKTNQIRITHQNIPQKKRYRIKQHFTNFLNDKYSQFVVKKTQFLKKKCDNQDSVLYEMKTLKPKQPQMSQINKRLKMQRMSRLQRCKQNILTTKQQNLNLVNIRIYEQFQDSKIINKIRRKIQYNIDKKQRKNKHWKSYVPNTMSFNRLSDFSLGN